MWAAGVKVGTWNIIDTVLYGTETETQTGYGPVSCHRFENDASNATTIDIYCVL